MLHKPIDYIFNNLKFKNIKASTNQLTDVLKRTREKVFFKLNVLMIDHFKDFYYIEPLENFVIFYVLVHKQNNQSVISETNFKKIFETNNVLFTNRYGLIEIRNYEIRFLFYNNEKELENYVLFYKKNIFGLVANKFLFTSKYGLCDQGLYLKKNQHLVYDNLKKVYEFLKIDLNELESIKNYNDYFQFLRKNPYYSTIYFDKYYMHKVGLRQRRFYYALKRIREIVQNQNEFVEPKEQFSDEQLKTYLGL